jgi:hypothetical protein
MKSFDPTGEESESAELIEQARARRATRGPETTAAGAARRR